MKSYRVTEERRLPESEMLVEVEIASETLEKARDAALKKIASEISVPGFRPGHVPENIAASKVGELVVLEEAAHAVIGQTLPKIISERKLAIVGTPSALITKLAPENPLVFRATFSVLPEVTLPDYKTIAVLENRRDAEKPEAVPVTEKEVDDFVSAFRETRSPEDSSPLPELTDKMVREFGDFKTVAEFRDAVRQDIVKGKQEEAREKHRQEIAEALLKAADFPAPRALTENELEKLFARLGDDLSRMGIAIKDFLKQVKKSEAELESEWRPEAVKRARLQILLDKIASVENIIAPKDETEAAVRKILEGRKNVDFETACSYVGMALRNEKVFKFLESR